MASRTPHEATEPRRFRNIRGRGPHPQNPQAPKLRPSCRATDVPAAGPVVMSEQSIRYVTSAPSGLATQECGADSDGAR